MSGEQPHDDRPPLPPPSRLVTTTATSTPSPSSTSSQLPLSLPPPSQQQPSTLAQPPLSQQQQQLQLPPSAPLGLGHQSYQGPHQPHAAAHHGPPQPPLSLQMPPSSVPQRIVSPLNHAPGQPLPLPAPGPLPPHSQPQPPPSQSQSPSVYSPYPPVPGQASPAGLPSRAQPLPLPLSQPQSQAAPARSTPPTSVPVKADPELHSPENLPDNIDELTPEEANRIIHSHRKVRYGTACWPCRQRKVRCDNEQPCENCVRRDHAKLCSYKPRKPDSGRGAASTSKKRAHSPGDQERGVRPDRKSSWPRPAIPNVESTETAEVSRYMGQNSIPALMREQSPDEKDDGNDSDVRQGVQSILGFNTSSAPFPLMSSRYLDSLAQEMMAELPSDREVLRLFKIYKETPQPFWGFVCDIEGFEGRLITYLEDRAEHVRGVKSPRPVAASWLAILFGCLATGSQFSDASYAVRTRDAQKYMQMAFHFLRMSNFLLRPTFETIQAMVITGFVLINDMKAEASWAMLGLCCRLAVSLGLHRPCRDDGSIREPPDPNSPEMTRRRIWWTCQWHDVLLSLSFDRNPMTNVPCCPIPRRRESDVEGLSYLEVMYHLAQIIGQRLTPASSTTYEYIVETCDMVERLRASCAPYLRNEPRNATESLQGDGLLLHTAFMMSVACRPALRRECPFDAEQKQQLAERCRANHIEVLRIFLKIHKRSSIPTRSWAFAYHGLSSALLLAILPETRNDPDVCQLQLELIAALSDTTAKDSATGSADGKDIELAGPLQRALSALQRLYGPASPQGGVGGGGGPSGAGQPGRFPSAGGKGGPSLMPYTMTGTVPPPAMVTSQLGRVLQQHQMGLQGQQQQPQQGMYQQPQQMQHNPYQPQQQQQQPDINAHQDAALTMATLSNGGSGTMPADMSGVMYSQQQQQQPQTSQQQQMNLAGMGEPTNLMSPMEVYDHIFWPPVSEAFNASLDSIPLEFLQSGYFYAR